MLTQEEWTSLWKEFELIHDSDKTPGYRPLARKYKCQPTEIQHQWKRYQEFKRSASVLKARMRLLNKVAEYCPEIRQALSRPLCPEFVPYRPHGTASIYRKLSDFIIPNMVYSFKYLSSILLLYASNSTDLDSPIKAHLSQSEVTALRESEGSGYLLFDPDALRKQAEQELGIFIPKGIRSLRSTYVFNKREEQKIVGNDICKRVVVFSEPTYMYCVAPDNAVYFMITTEKDKSKNLIIFINELLHVLSVTKELRDDAWSATRLEYIYYVQSCDKITYNLDERTIYFHVIFGNQEAIVHVYNHSLRNAYDSAHLSDRIGETEVIPISP